MRALLVKCGKLETVELRNDYRAINEAIDADCFTSCFHVDAIIGYCDDNGYITGRVDFSAVPEPGMLRRDAYPIAGPIVIMGTKPDGDYRGLTDAEVARFAIDPSRGVLLGISGGTFVPTLTYRKGA